MEINICTFVACLNIRLSRPPLQSLEFSYRPSILCPLRRTLLTTVFHWDLLFLLLSSRCYILFFFFPDLEPLLWFIFRWWHCLRFFVRLMFFWGNKRIAITSSEWVLFFEISFFAFSVKVLFDIRFPVAKQLSKQDMWTQHTISGISYGTYK